MSFPDSFGQILFFAAFAWVVGGTIYKVAKYRGLAPAVFGAPIERTIGQFALGTGMRVKVHKLNGGTPDKAIGVEFVQATLPVLAIALSASEAQRLATLIQSVVGRDEHAYPDGVQ